MKLAALLAALAMGACHEYTLAECEAACGSMGLARFVPGCQRGWDACTCKSAVPAHDDSYSVCGKCARSCAPRLVRSCGDGGPFHTDVCECESSQPDGGAR